MATEPASVDPGPGPALHLVAEQAAQAPPARAPAPSARAAQGRSPAATPRGRRTSGPDRLSVMLFSLAGVLVVLTFLTKQFIADTSASAAHRQIVVRKIYRTTIVETVPGQGAGTSISQSVSSSGGSYSAGPAATTRSSSAP